MIYTGWRFKWVGTSLYATDRPETPAGVIGAEGGAFDVILGEYDVDTLNLYDVTGDVVHSVPDVTYGQAKKRAQTYIVQHGGVFVPDTNVSSPKDPSEDESE